jgi:CRP-like cAMP-binding protein
MSHGSRPPPPESRPKNRLLRALPDDCFYRLNADLQTVPIAKKFLFHKQGQPLSHVYFPNGGMASITTLLTNGDMVESATVGDEGMIGIEAFLGDRALAPGETMMQVPDTDAVMLAIEPFRREVALHGALFSMMGRYTQTVIAQMMQAAACNAHHPVQERCARWLLMTHDRVHQDQFNLSHEFLGIMLGVRRQTVSVVAGALQVAGLIQYSHGNVTVLNRFGLEAASCECYAAIARHYNSLNTLAT